MVKSSQYQSILKQLTQEWKERAQYDDLEHHAIIDEQFKHFLVLRTGWIDSKNYHTTIIHLELKEDGKVWVHKDNTEWIIVDDLLHAGFTNDQIVLAFHAPERRPDTDFAY
ncbi:MAG: element excision factor XisI family protein [Bacteroidota bacterium]